MEMPSTNQLHRELLRWIQSLDLAYSIKNVKRDFANGFLVAEILSRYYDKDVSMHSFDNGIGHKIKRDNWDQLVKLCGRIPDLEPLANRTEIDAVIHCQNGAAVAFLTKLYQCLTKRTVPPVVVAPTVPAKAKDPTGEAIPPYAKPTGTAVIRDKMRDADIAETNDETELGRKIRGMQSQHEEQLQLERLVAMNTPDRFPALRSASKATVLRGATKPVRNDDGPVLMTQTVVKEVQIKSMNEKSLEKLRLTREAKQNETLGTASSAVGVSFDHHSRSGGSGGGSSNSTTELVQKRRPFDLLQEAVNRKLPSLVVAKLETQRGKDRFDAFIDLLHDSSDPQCPEWLTDVVDDPVVLASAFLDFPRDFWKFAGILLPFVAEYDDEHALFVAVHQALVRIGKQCVQRDATSSMVLLTDVLLPKLTTLLATYSTKRALLLQVAYAFAPATVLGHLQVIKRLREALPNDIPLFCHILSILVYMETELDETLVDLYYYYCCIGLETPCDKLRAASLSMLVPFVSYDLTLIADLLPRLTQFSSRNAWWEVKTQLLIVASAFLHATAQSSRDDTEQIELALALIEREFHPIAHLNVRRVGLSYLAKNLSQYQELVPLYVDVLLSLPLAMRTTMLAPSQSDLVLETLPMRGVSGAHYELRALVPQWDAVAVAKQIYYERKTHDHADLDALQVLRACIAQLTTSTSTLGDAATLFEQIQGFVALGLLDVAASGDATQLLLDIMRSGACTTQSVLGNDALRQSLATLATRQVDDLRQQRAVHLLHAARALDAAAVVNCVAAVATQSREFKRSLFALSFEE